MAAPPLRRALSNDQIMRIFAGVTFARGAAEANGTTPPGEHAVRDALIAAGACSGDIVYYLSMIARGLNAHPSFTRAERLSRLRAFSDPFDFDVKAQASAKATFGYAFIPRRPNPNEVRADANKANWPRALTDEQLAAICLEVDMAHTMGSMPQGAEADRLTTPDEAIRDELVRSGALPGDILCFVSRLILGITADPTMSADERDREIRRRCDVYGLDVQRRPAGTGSEAYTLTPRSVH